MILERDPRGWYKRPTKGNTTDNRRYFADHLVDTESCTHTMGVQGQKCPWCGGVVP